MEACTELETQAIHAIRSVPDGELSAARAKLNAARDIVAVLEDMASLPAYQSRPARGPLA